MKRSGFKKPTLERKAPVLTPVPMHLRRSATYGPAQLAPIAPRIQKQAKTAEDKRHMDKVAQLGCAVCWRLHGMAQPQVELHHPRTGVGMGQRSAHKDVIPLCVEHHRGQSGVHGLGTKGFEKAYGFSELDLLSDVTTRLSAS